MAAPAGAQGAAAAPNQHAQGMKMSFARASLGDGIGANLLFDYGQTDDTGIMNGQGRAIRKMHATTGINDAFKWVTIDVEAAVRAGATFESVLRALIRVYVGRIEGAGNATQYNTRALAQSAGTILAICRMSGAQVYALTDNHLVQGQTTAGVWHAEVPAQNPAGGNAGAPRTPAHISVNGATYGVQHQDYADNLDLSDMTDLVKFAICSYPMVSACIMFMGHHYISTAEDTAQHMSMLKGFEGQFLDKATVKLNDKYGVTMEQLKDLVIHKAPHPVSDGTFGVIGSSPTVALNLKSMGFSSVSLRLPLKSDQQKALTSASAFFRQVGTIKSSLNLELPQQYESYDTLLSDAVQKAGVAMDVFNAMTSSERDGILEPYVSALQPEVALAYGLFCGYSEVMGSALAATLTKSVTAKKSREGHAGLFTEGYQHGQCAARYKKKEVDAGGLQGVAIGGASAPDKKDPVVDPARTEQNDLLKSIITAVVSKA